MPLPPVDSVDVVLKTPEAEKGRDRVRKPGERGRRHGQRDQERPYPEAPRPDDTASSLEPAAQSAAADDHDQPDPPPGQAYGPAADVRDEEPERHSIDYRA